MTAPELDQALANLDQADTARAAALAELDTAQRHQAAARRQAVTDAWQTWAGQWDPQADDQAVTDTRAALEDALRTGPLAPLLAVLVAEHRRTAHRALAARAQGVGVTVPNHRPAPDPTDPATLLPQLLGNLAAGIVADETAAVDTTVRAALAAVPGGKPIAYRVTSPRSDSWIEQIGGLPNLEWTDGTVVLDADDARVDYFRRRSNDYTIEPLYVLHDRSVLAPMAPPTGSQQPTDLSNAQPGVFTLTAAERAAIRRGDSQ